MDEKEKSGRFHRQQEVPSAEEKSKSGTVYDDVFRTMIDKIPHLVIPLINEVFGKQYPHSCVLYLRYTDRTPDFLVVHMKFPDGTVADYRTPIIKVNRYDFEDIFRKKLLFFLPYYIMRYEAVLKEIEEDEEKLRDFLGEYQCIYQKLNALRDCHQLSDYDFTELKRLIETIVNHLAYGKEKIQKGVRDMGGKVLEFEHDILMRESEARGVLKGQERGDARRLVKNVESIMRTLDLSLEKACEAMETTVEDYTKAKHLILGEKKCDRQNSYTSAANH